MSVRAITERLAHPFVRLHAYFRKQLELLRDFMRCYKAARTRSAAETRSTAIHEAGHAVILIALGLAFRAVSIIPDVREGTLGQVYLARHDRTADLLTFPREAIYLRYSMVYYAGAEAVRQLIPTHPNPDAGASTDKRRAANLIRHSIGGDAQSVDLLLLLAKRRCALLVDHYQPEIQALAGALEAELILSAEAARKVFMRSLRKRATRPLSFAVDPTLDGLAGDEAFRAFLRRLNLPTRAN
jgi:hypothetical protein